jgi:hypothetical protein
MKTSQLSTDLLNEAPDVHDESCQARSMLTKTEQEDQLTGVGVAPGQYLGYGLQPVRMCARLLLAKEGDYVSTEHLDDVAVHSADGMLLLEQTKSALSKNPVSDWAIDLWKTFANWIGTTTKLSLDPKSTHYVLYVAPGNSGQRVSELHQAYTKQQVDAIVEAVRADLASRPTAPVCADHLEVFLEADPTTRAAIVANFSLIGQDDPLEEIRNHLASAVSPVVLDDICATAIGWVKTAADKLLRARQPAKIAVSDFRTRLRAIVKRQDRDHVLNSVASLPDDAAIDAEVRRRTYIRQMELIECASDEKLRAASDFLRASADRTNWSDRGLVDETSLAEFDDRLERRWISTKRSVAIQAKGLPEIEAGQLLLAETLKSGNERLQSMEVPPTFPRAPCIPSRTERPLAGIRDT